MQCLCWLSALVLPRKSPMRNLLNILSGVQHYNGTRHILISTIHYIGVSKVCLTGHSCGQHHKYDKLCFREVMTFYEKALEQSM